MNQRGFAVFSIIIIFIILVSITSFVLRNKTQNKTTTTQIDSPSSIPTSTSTSTKDNEVYEDKSYMEFQLNSDVKVLVTDSKGNSLNEFLEKVPLTEDITEFPDESTSIWMFSYYKPPDGIYYIKIHDANTYYGLSF